MRRWAMAAVLALVCGGLIAALVRAQSPVPGSDADPLVTKSYVDQAVQQAVEAALKTLAPSADQAVQALVAAEVQKAVDQPLRFAQGQAVQARLQSEQVLQVQALQVVQVPRGQKLVADAGTEIVVRAGSAVVIASPAGGLADLTAGKDVGLGEPGRPNHLLLVPRGDGRGLLAETDLIVLVRGRYEIRP